MNQEQYAELLEEQTQLLKKKKMNQDEQLRAQEIDRLIKSYERRKRFVAKNIQDF